MPTRVLFLGEECVLEINDDGDAVWTCKFEPVIGKVLTSKSRGMLVSVSPNPTKQLAYDLAKTVDYVEILETDPGPPYDHEVLY